MGRVRILYDGRLALTIAQAAERYGVQPDTIRKELARLGVVPLPEGVNERTPLYSAAEIDRVMKARPGRGVNFRKVR